MPPNPLSPFRYAERVPRGRAASWILSYWAFQSDVGASDSEPYTVWPDGCASIAIARTPGQQSMVVCVGPRHTALQPPMSAGRRIWGVRLWPDAIRSLLGIDARTLRDHVGLAPVTVAVRFASLGAVLPPGDDTEHAFDVMDQWGDAWAAQAEPTDAYVRAAIRAIVAGRGEVPMEQVARAAGIGLRQLQRRFPAATGLSLREYARVRRLREALALRLASHPIGWSRIAAETGFVDHAHLTREFVSLTGVAPSEAARQLARTAHRGVTP